MFVEFLQPWSNYKHGQRADLEPTLARRLISLGKAKYPEKAARRTTPQGTPEPAAKPKPKKKPRTRYKAREKAVKIDT